MTRTYLDYASTAPLRPESRAAMADWLRKEEPLRGDPSRSHFEGFAARTAREHSPDRIAAALSVRPRQVLFCSGATEAIATASFGAANRRAGRAHSVVSAVEHTAVTRWADRGVSTTVPVDETGRVNVDDVAEAIRADTAVVHLQWTNHEVGTTQPVPELAELCAESESLLHVDAAQAGTQIAGAVASGADLTSISGHKLGGPSSGLLILRKGLRLPPLLVGGDQERARRGGMEDVLAAVGLAAAVEATCNSAVEEAERSRHLCDRLISWADQRHGVSMVGNSENRAPNIVCLTLDDIEPQPVLMGLDSAGIAAHSGSACSSEIGEPSAILQAMGVDAHHSLRLSVGWNSTDSDVSRALDVLDRLLDELSSLRKKP